MRISGKSGVGLLDFGEGGFFGFIGDGEASEVGKGRELLLTAFSEEVAGKIGIIGTHGGLDDGVVGLVSLDDDIGDIKMSASDATNDLGEKLKTAFFGGKIG